MLSIGPLKTTFYSQQMSIPAIRVFTVEHVKKVEALCCIRNQQEGETGSLEEISFQQFLMVMSHFRPPTLKTSEEEKEALRREKLRCKFPRAIPLWGAELLFCHLRERAVVCEQDAELSHRMFLQRAAEEEISSSCLNICQLVQPH